MKTIKIFLGSSFKVRAERVAIGDAMRKLSEKWEEKLGVRIKLLVWEDFCTEYSGLSKQEEYNQKLVAESDIATFLFKDKIGSYTLREMECALKQNSNKVVCFCLSDVSEEVLVQLRDKNLEFIPYTSVSDYIDQLEMIFPSFLSEVQDIPQTPWLTKRFSVTIPEDLSGEREEFGNMMRSLDDIVEANCNMRCSVLPYNHLESVNHYVALLNNQLTDDERNDLLHTFEYQPTHKTLEAISIFVKKGEKDTVKDGMGKKALMGNILTNDSQTADFLKEREAFPTSYREMDTIKLYLLLWFLHQRQVALKPDDDLFSIQDKTILFKKLPIASTEAIDDDHFHLRLELIEQEYRKLKNLSFSSSNSDIDKIYNEIGRIRHSLIALLYQNLKTALIPQISSVDVAQKIDSKAISEQVENESVILNHLQNDFVDKWERNANLLASRCEYIRKHFKNNSELQDLLQVVKDWRRITYKIYKSDETKYQQVLDALFYQVGINDTYLNCIDNDLYKEIIDFADKVDVDNLQIENMRFNYANGLSRAGNHQEAKVFYEEAIRRVKSFDMQSFAERRSLTHFYTTLFHEYFELTPHGDEASRTLQTFGNQVKAWMQEDRDTYIVDYACYLSAYLKNIPIKEENRQLLNEAEAILDELETKMMPSDEYYRDVPCYLLNMIAVYYVDRINECSLTNEEYERYFHQAIKYSLRQIRDCGRMMQYDNCSALIMMSSAYHQIGFAYAFHLRDWRKSYKSYLRALQIRNRLVHIVPSSECLVAETSVNMGALLLQLYRANMLQKKLKTELVFWADKALHIYQEHLSFGSVGSELRLCQAKLLKGTSICALAENHEEGYDMEEGKSLVRGCWSWHLRHPNTDYASTFIQECIPILFKL